ncbi:MAG: pyridoxal phosphate-dependent aminotransferase [Cyclobacteriaceae bacterium]
MIIKESNRISDIKEYYFVKKLEQVQELRNQGHDVINFGIGSPDLSPDETVLNQLAIASKKGIDGYQPYRGRQDIRESISNWYSTTYNITLDFKNEVLPLMGSKEGIFHISQAFLNEGDEVLIPNPGYPAYASVTKLTGAVSRPYNLSEENGWFPDLTSLAKEDLSKVKIMWVNYPHMPTGTAPKASFFKELIAFAKEKGILICHDNPYSLVLNQQDPMSILSVDGAKEVAIELNSLSKSHNMAGWRVGMLVGKSDYLASVLKVKSNMDSGMYYGIQQATIAALKIPSSWHNERNAVYSERKQLIYQLLDLLNCEYDKNQVGLFVWAKPKEKQAIDELVDRLLFDQHIFITPGKIFGSQGESYIRLSLCVDKETIQKAIDRLT